MDMLKVKFKPQVPEPTTSQIIGPASQVKFTANTPRELNLSTSKESLGEAAIPLNSTWPKKLAESDDIGPDPRGRLYGYCNLQGCGYQLGDLYKILGAPPGRAQWEKSRLSGSKGSFTSGVLAEQDLGEVGAYVFNSQCTNCGEHGHWARECKSGCGICGAKDHVLRKCGQNKVKCFNCGKSHLVEDCSAPCSVKRCDASDHTKPYHMRRC